MGFLTGEKYTTLDLQRRFDVINRLDVRELDIWFVDAAHGGVPANWLPFLRNYLAGTLSSSSGGRGGRGGGGGGGGSRSSSNETLLPLQMALSPHGSEDGDVSDDPRVISVGDPRVSGVSDHPRASDTRSNRTALVWMGWDRRTDEKLDTTISWFADARRSSLLTASPTCHTIGI